MTQSDEHWTLREHEITIRVRYQETDAQGRVHHANYINFFEIGRVEFLRAAGYSYRNLESDGVFLVVTELECRYLGPAYYDDLLQIKTIVARAQGTRIEHRYEVRKAGEMIAIGRSVVAAVDRQGKVCRLPKFLRAPRKTASDRAS
jgi:acyl-CoA thioester hydrolase